VALGSDIAILSFDTQISLTHSTAPTILPTHDLPLHHHHHPPNKKATVVTMDYFSSYQQQDECSSFLLLL
jgi:hypothetical protein